MSNYFRNPKTSQKTVLIFDMYGHDTAGYMLVRYMAEEFGVQATVGMNSFISPDAAIQIDVAGLNMFSEARPPGIRCNTVVDVLYQTVEY